MGGTGRPSFACRWQRGDHVVGLIRQRRERHTREAVVVLELRGSRHKHERHLDLGKLRRELGGGIPGTGAHHDDAFWPVGARVLEPICGHIEQQGRFQEQVISVAKRIQAERCPQWVEPREDRRIEARAVGRPKKPIAQAAERPPGRMQSRPERRRVGQGEQKRKGREGRPRPAPGLGSGERSPGHNVHEDCVGALLLDRLLQVCRVMPGAGAEDPHRPLCPAHRRLRFPIIHFQGFDARLDQLRLEPHGPQFRDFAGEGAQRDFVASPAKLLENRHEREEMPVRGRGIGEYAAQLSRSIRGSISSRIACLVCCPLRPRSRRMIFQT